MNSQTEFVTKGKLLELEADIKPKGICLVSEFTDSVLALLGKPKDVFNMTAFPPSTVYQQYEVSLKCFSSLVSDKNQTTSRHKIVQEQSNDQSLNHEDAIANKGNPTCTMVTNSEHLPSLRLPDGSVFKGSFEAVEKQKMPLISELKFDVPELLGDSKEVFQGTTLRGGLPYETDGDACRKFGI